MIFLHIFSFILILAVSRVRLGKTYFLNYIHPVFQLYRGGGGLVYKLKKFTLLLFASQSEFGCDRGSIDNTLLSKQPPFLPN